MKNDSLIKQQKIIHIDMDCFFAAIKIRDNSLLKNKPVAIGGLPENRGVLSTYNGFVANNCSNNKNFKFSFLRS